MKIAIFGCSYTHGVPHIDNGISWAQILSEKYTNIQFDNYAFLGSSVLFQINLLKNLKNQYDKTIFQITQPGRITYWKSDNKKFMTDRIQNKNYSYFEYKFDDIQIITPGILKRFNLYHRMWKMDKGKRQYAKLHYSKVCPELIDCEHEIYTNYISENCDLYFTHTEILQKSKSFNFKKDWANHFFKEGHAWQATWVENECIKRGIIDV